MAITYTEENRILTLTTARTSYQMQVAQTGHLLHLYYGATVTEATDYLHLLADHGFSPNPYELRSDRNWSLDQLPSEISSCNTGDFRLSALDITTASGAIGCDLRYCDHRILAGGYKLQGLPAARGDESDTQTLIVRLADDAAQIEVELFYGVYEACDVITRALRIRNTSDRTCVIEQAASVCLDLSPYMEEAIHFHGRHAGEMNEERVKLPTGIMEISSKRGMSGHQHNPFLICCEKETTEDNGNCTGVMLMYSGNHCLSVERDQSRQVRVVAGINRDLFCWHLESGDVFETPQAILSHSAAGLTALSHNYHDFLRQHVIRRPVSETVRPVVLNSWEALYCDYDENDILALAKEAAGLNIDLLVMDDGWFGNRIDDRRALGDWYENKDRFPSGLKTVAEKITATGLRFGIWMEPEMISEESELMKAHPEWVLRVPGRAPSMSREQLVLDMSRTEVTDHLYDVIGTLLSELPVTYVKWDMNRGLTDVFRGDLNAERMRELPHRYVLGVYRLLERLTERFPEVLFEGCAGGGGRMDAGMLYYVPQIWASDNTDAIARLTIQRGYSYGYPAGALGAHVAAVPGHQTHRTVPFGVRGMVAMSGAFGYELDPAALTQEEKEEVKRQVAQYHADGERLNEGRYYRLQGTQSHQGVAAWQQVSADGALTVLNVVVTNVEANAAPTFLRLKGLKEDAQYVITREERYGDLSERDAVWLNKTAREGLVFTSKTLMTAGLSIPPLQGDCPGIQYRFVEVTEKRGA